MTLLARITRLEHRRPVGADLGAVADGILAIFAASTGTDEALPSRATVLDHVRRGWAISCRSHCIRYDPDTGGYLDRCYPGVDLRYTTGQLRAEDHPANRTDSRTGA